jgi:hypothetical protein
MGGQGNMGATVDEPLIIPANSALTRLVKLPIDGRSYPMFLIRL